MWTWRHAFGDWVPQFHSCFSIEPQEIECIHTMNSWNMRTEFAKANLRNDIHRCLCTTCVYQHIFSHPLLLAPRALCIHDDTIIILWCCRRAHTYEYMGHTTSRMCRQEFALKRAPWRRLRCRRRSAAVALRWLSPCACAKGFEYS